MVYLLASQVGTDGRLELLAVKGNHYEEIAANCVVYGISFVGNGLWRGADKRSRYARAGFEEYATGD